MNERGVWSGHNDLEEQLDKLPELVSAALMEWRIATLDREKCEALLYAATRGQDDKMPATEVRARIQSNPNRYEAVLKEIKAEANYQLLYERLLSVKKRASLRTAF